MLSPYERDELINPPVVGFAEGTFVTWNYVWDVVVAFGDAWSDMILVNDNGEIHLFSVGGFQYYFYAGGVEVLRGGYDMGGAGSIGVGPRYSALHGYVVFRDNAANSFIEVFNRAGSVWRRDVSLDVVGVTNLRYFGMSPTGEYIGVLARVPPAVDHMTLYRGA